MKRSPMAWLAELSEPLPASSRPMRGGMGRALRLRAALEVLPPSDRQLVIDALGEIMRPMSPRELEQALLRTETTRADRRKLVMALKPFSIMLVAE